VKRFLMMACLALQALGTASAAAEAPPWQWSNVERVVVFADVHGAYNELSGLLRQVGMIDADAHWTGGRTHLVSLGDLLSRGPDSRKVLDLLMRLEGEARAAGGDLHVVLGNHELMHLTGDLRYATPPELAQYTEFETPEMREEIFARLRAGGWKSAEPEAAARAAFEDRFPKGYLGHRAAFAPEGRYGAWLLQKPVLIRVNDALFMHGGLPITLASVDTATFVESLNRELRTAVAQIRELIATGLLDPDTDPALRERVARERLAVITDPPAAARLLDLIDAVARFDTQSLLTTEAGPLWYRGTSLCNPLTEGDVVTRVLQHYGVKRAFVGHTPTLDARIASRFDGRVVRVDTGMLTLAFKGRPAALEITSNGLRAYYAGEAAPRAVDAEPRRLGRRPAALPDDDTLAEFLRTATVTSIEPMPGTDSPKKVTLERGPLRVAAIFKSTDSGPRARSHDREGEINSSQRWQHEVAAYQVDRLLGLELVPVTVEREIDGRRGSLQFWIDDLISNREAVAGKVPLTGYCSLDDQHALMLVFDALIKNANRHAGNFLYERDSGMLRLIDHSRSFRLGGLPEMPKVTSRRVTETLARNLAALTPERITEVLSRLLEREQVRALIARRDALLKLATKQNARPQS
jgi:hypothetical protein